MPFKDFLFLALHLSCLAERNCLVNSGRGPYGKHLGEIMLNLYQQIMGCYSFHSDGHFQSKTSWAILVEGLMENICETIF